MFRYGSFLWVSLRSFLISTFWWFIAKCIQRLRGLDCKNQENDANFNVNHSREDDQEVVSMIPRDFEPEEKKSSEFSFSFLYQESRKDSLGNFAVTDDSAFVQSGFYRATATRRYQIVSGKNVGEFLQKAEATRFTVREMFVASSANDQSLDLGALTNKMVKELEEEEEGGGNNSEEKVAEFDSEDSSIGLIEELNLEEESEMSNSIEENRSVSGEENNGFDEEEEEDISYDLQWLPRNEFPESSGEFQPENYSYGLPDEILASEAIVTEDTSEDTEYIELEPDVKNPESDCAEKSVNSSLEREFWESKNSVGNEDEDEDEFDILLEHQQLIKQMKMEMKKSKKKSLPTIAEEAEEEYEECVTPKIAGDLKPLKIEEKIFEFKDFMEEIHKFYKSYAEKMRKLDILNYQSLHAINIVQLKDSRVFVLSKKAAFPFIKHFGIVGKQRKVFADPSLKSFTEMQRDLELVYIGQVCLSWEILRWQYGKLKLLLEYEYRYISLVHRTYNVVAGEHQQLQVLMHRFLEDEPIQGPRIKHYVENRCLCRSLLQVPIIKDDDCSKKDRLVGEKDAIPITELAETIKDSMQVFSEFIRSDKDGTNGAFKGTQLVNPSDLELLSNIKTCLKKKERKLKDIQRSGNCIVKKFRRHNNNNNNNNEETAAGGMSSGSASSAAAVFISQVELKLVSRVLSMSRLTTDQLEWCLKKLYNINIVNRNVHVEPSFLLFPC